MNAEFVRAAVSRFGDNPEGISHFRKVVIGLAIAGKLAGEGQLLSPAKMLDQIESEKIRLLRDGQISRPKHYSPVTDEQLPEVFSDPSSFVALGAVARVEKGLTGIQGAKSGSFPLVVTAAERGSCDHFDFEGPATIVPLVSSTGHGNASINRLHYQEGRFALGTILAAIFPYAPNLISARFIFEYLSTFKDELLVSRMTGTANVTLSVGRLAEVPVPLICPSIQRKADELMALCDQLEAARVSREAARDTFTLSTLAKLNTPDPETFASDARFALANLAPLTTHPVQIKQLRQTILNLAVRGKLVEQDPSDEPASELLKQIEADKAELTAAGKLRNTKPLPSAKPDEFSGEIPAGWGLARLGDVTKLWNGFAFKSSDFQSSGVPVIRIGDLQDGEVSLSGAVCVSNQIANSLGYGFWIPDGALLLAMSGATTGKTAFNNTGQRLLLNQRVGRIEPFRMSIKFIKFFFETIIARNLSISFGTAIPNLSAQQINETVIPLPPLAEQHRIVAKVDELMALCDQLEASITTGEQTRSRLLEAVLHNALEPFS